MKFKIKSMYKLALLGFLLVLAPIVSAEIQVRQIAFLGNSVPNNSDNVTLQWVFNPTVAQQLGCFSFRGTNADFS